MIITGLFGNNQQKPAGGGGLFGNNWGKNYTTRTESSRKLKKIKESSF
jgi:hypothetical protein